MVSGMADDVQPILITQQVSDAQALFAGLAGAENFAWTAQFQIAAGDFKTVMTLPQHRQPGMSDFG